MLDPTRYLNSLETMMRLKEYQNWPKGAYSAGFFFLTKSQKLNEKEIQNSSTILLKN